MILLSSSSKFWVNRYQADVVQTVGLTADQSHLRHVTQATHPWTSSFSLPQTLRNVLDVCYVGEGVPSKEGLSNPRSVGQGCGSTVLAAPQRAGPVQVE